MQKIAFCQKFSVFVALARFMYQRCNASYDIADIGKGQALNMLPS